MNKCIFLDIDGTLYDHQDNRGISESTKKALKLAKANGHRLIICTGRVRSSVDKNILNLDFDGQIFGAGSQVVVNDQNLYLYRIPLDELKEILKKMEELQIGYTLEGEEGGYYDSIAHEQFKKDQQLHHFTDEQMEKRMAYFQFHSIDEYDEKHHHINKLTYYAQDQATFEYFQTLFTDKMKHFAHGLRDNGYYVGELVSNQVSKATGMNVILDYFHMSHDTSIAYGDSVNDLEILKEAHLGICMGNGDEAAKQAADQVIERIENDAIYKSFKELGLISD